MLDDVETALSFKQEALRRLINLYEKAKANKLNDKDKHRLEGFLHAGEYLGLLTHAEGEKLLEQAHNSVFGEGIKSRKARRDKLRRAVESDDELFFETPALLRNKG